MARSQLELREPPHVMCGWMCRRSEAAQVSERRTQVPHEAISRPIPRPTVSVAPALRARALRAFLQSASVQSSGLRPHHLRASPGPGACYAQLRAVVHLPAPRCTLNVTR